MPIVSARQLEGVENPELVFGLVAAVGTPLRYLSTVLADALRKYNYEAEHIHLSSLLSGFTLPTPPPDAASTEYERINRLMSRGNELRERLDGGDALALLAAAEINARRPPEPPRVLPGKAFVLHQLKHPDEVVSLRSIYGGAFHLIGVYCPERIRLQYLNVMRGLSREESEGLIQRDKGEESKYGQHLTRTFHLSDVFVDLRGYDEGFVADATDQVFRYMKLLFGEEIITPTRDEYGMFLAYSAALRSADLSRQVGAAILAPTSEVVGLGANEVPSPGGGQYWGGTRDARDFVKGADENAVIKQEALEEVVAALTPGWDEKMPEEQQLALGEAAEKLGGTRLMNLTEFTRAAHAEMEAILSAGRVGVSPRGCELYTTTFPCHNCAKHIVTAGIMRVVYIEPYPKSLAARLHGDAIAFPEDEDRTDKVAFDPFRGVAPRMYVTLFSSLTPEGRRIKRKVAIGGSAKIEARLRSKASPFTHIDREAIAALAIHDAVQPSREEAADGFYPG